MTQIDFVKNVNKKLKFKDIEIGDFFRADDGDLCVKTIEMRNMNAWDIFNKIGWYFLEDCKVELVDRITIQEG